MIINIKLLTHIGEKPDLEFKKIQKVKTKKAPLCTTETMGGVYLHVKEKIPCNEILNFS